MNRILLATICGIILGAVIFAMAQRDRFVDAQNLASIPSQAIPSQKFLAPTNDSLRPFDQSNLNPQAPRSGRSKIGTTRGRDRSAFTIASTDDSSLLADSQTVTSERARILLEQRLRREKNREQARLRAAELSGAMNDRVERERVLRDQRLALIRARQTQLTTDPSQLLLSTAATNPLQDRLQNGISSDVARAMDLINNTLAEGPFRPTDRNLTDGSIDSLIGALTNDLNGSGGSSALAALLKKLGFGDFDFGAGIKIATFGLNGLPEFLFSQAKVETLWIPVERSRNSRLLNSTRTNDLFVVFPKPTLVTVIESPQNVGVQVTGGTFVQITGGSNGPTSLNPDDVRAYDSFLTLNGKGPAFAGDSVPDPEDWGNIIETTWFSIPPGPGIVDPSRFGDSRSYVWVGRFTVKANAGARPVVNGRLRVSSLDLLSGKIGDDFLLVKADTSLWSPINELAPTTPRLRALQPSTSSLESGKDLTLSIDLDSTAPRTGIDITLKSDNPLIILPDTASIPYKAIGIDVTIPTTFSFEPADVVISASFDGEQITRFVHLDGHVKGDTTRDGFVDGADLGLLLGAWGMGDVPIADLNADGNVDGADLGLLLGAWRSSNSVPQELGTNARWIPVPISASCAVPLENVRTADLYIGFDQEPDNKRIIIRSAPDTGLRIEGGIFYQNQFGTNLPPNEGLYTFDPCLAYDSYITVGDSLSPLFTPGNAPDSLWGTNLAAEWFQANAADVSVENNPSKFGDSRFYIRIARISVSLGSTFVGGNLTIIDGPTLTDIPIDNCLSCWGSFDFNRDSVIDAKDLQSLTLAIGSTSAAHDIDGNGMVNADDMRLFLAAYNAGI